MKTNNDAFGRFLLAAHQQNTPSAEIIERDDGYIDLGSEPGLYFSEFKKWSAAERRLLTSITGRALDIGCGAGRHTLYLQEKGVDVTGIDASPGAVAVCRLRGVRRVFTRTIADADKFRSNSFDTILMLGNNFGLFANREGVRTILQKFSKIASPGARIIAGCRNPYQTHDRDHLDYHKRNRKQGRLSAQIRMRVRYRKAVGEWFDYLLVSPEEMRELLEGTHWRVEQVLGAEEANYIAVISRVNA